MASSLMRCRSDSSSRLALISRPTSASADISVPRRCDSLYRRAFWMAVPMLAAIVDNRRTSFSAKRPYSVLL
jgi:hypothetical protein